MGKMVYVSAFSWLFLVLAGNNDMHESLNDFLIWPDLIMDYGVSGP